VLGRVRSAVFEPALLITKLNWYPCKRRHSRWKLSQELNWKMISFLPDCIHTKMAGRKRERCKTEPRISVPFMLELEYESKIIKGAQSIAISVHVWVWLTDCKPMSVYLFFCPSACNNTLFKNHTPNSAKFSIHVTYGCGFIVHWQQCNALCTSGIVDDVTFPHNAANAPELRCVGEQCLMRQQRLQRTSAFAAAMGHKLPGNIHKNSSGDEIAKTISHVLQKLIKIRLPISD